MVIRICRALAMRRGLLGAATFDFRLSIWELEPRQIPPSHIWHLRVPCAAVLGSVVQEVWPLREGPMA
ncbi:hypothetical protein TNCV_1214401 [Trichonephila clavipes]|nr:hypothetical protein TNCV_1214401 [Trichonephila clavipes]